MRFPRLITSPAAPPLLLVFVAGTGHCKASERGSQYLFCGVDRGRLRPRAGVAHGRELTGRAGGRSEPVTASALLGLDGCLPGRNRALRGLHPLGQAGANHALREDGLCHAGDARRHR